MFRSKKKLLMWAAVLGVGYYMWKKHQSVAIAQAALAAAAPAGNMLHGLTPTVFPNATTRQGSNVVLNSWNR